MSLCLIDAGGTITSVPGPSGALHGDGHEDRLRRHLPPELRSLRIQPVYSGLSEDMSFADMAAVTRAIGHAEDDPDIQGIVVAHGTDVMEETAYLSDLCHRLRKPVIFTGAQRAPGAADYDGLRNLTDALVLAARRDAASQGTLIVFGGRILPAWQAMKDHTTDLAAFTARDRNAGSIRADAIDLPRPASRPEPFQWGVPADTVAPILLGAACSGAMIRAAQIAGYEAVVISALGRGNASRDVVDAARAADEQGMILAISSRCPGGPVGADYESAVRLVEAGAIMSHALPASQTRMLLSMILAGPKADCPKAKFRQSIEAYRAPDHHV